MDKFLSVGVNGTDLNQIFFPFHLLIFNKDKNIFTIKSQIIFLLFFFWLYYIYIYNRFLLFFSLYFIYLLLYCFTALLIYLFTCLLVYLFTYLLIYLFTDLLIYWFTDLLIYWFTCSCLSTCIIFLFILVIGMGITKVRILITYSRYLSVSTLIIFHPYPNLHSFLSIMQLAW